MRLLARGLGDDDVHAAAGNPAAYIQARAGHAQGSITERYIHAAQLAFPGAVEKTEGRMFGAVTG
jgi:hypothetical protein